VKVLMVTPHLPPQQAANALLPHLLGRALAGRGIETRYLTFGSGPDTGEVSFVTRRSQRLRATRIPQALEAGETVWKARRLVRAADVLHIHSNTWMNQVAGRLAERARRPYILTHYGTEVWHHDGRDRLFRRLNERAHHVTFYSQALLDRGRELEIPLPRASVIYPPVQDVFRPPSEERREEARRRYLPGGGVLLLNVKRLHPLADHATLLEAMARVRARRARAMLMIAGAGAEEAALKARATRLGLDSAVRFLGLVPNEDLATLQGAADLFVLSSLLEATPTVALEALAAGTPVVSTDSPGGVELHGIFGGDVALVPRSRPDALAEAVLSFLESPRRAAPATARTIEERFRLESVAERYLGLYREAMAP
jgi:glycosyltransferase involved in cell wall biosynthesis